MEGRIGRTAADGAFFLLLKIGMDGLPIDDLVDFEQREAVEAVYGNDGLGGLLEKAAQKKIL